MCYQRSRGPLDPESHVEWVEETMGKRTFKGSRDEAETTIFVSLWFGKVEGGGACFRLSGSWDPVAAENEA